ncbi:FAD dependent oxidoreductase [Metschnikowia bicuspidata var. bicuspidata NRRL YB-4993]|uniref:FAD dependent oxidoreductase n=1 Tax=Metschnikowia bicuspidata var. bicuspidata NRRL YB-4993 TaxID=869754 RepID=A0A1A0H6W9_9ASCO|nr:FAD dependent oxidoreductase [Metschnikowia bicuspidata var. bicuspidata NRRL YB-4993]OBA19653.1 FAD dependent oxidoreductase [Metschnikowia bicuspidata var. bicuspidata NRRL YB-4993]
MPEYQIIGAGIIGLYTAFQLLDRGIDAKQISITAEFLPGDESIRYTSPYAGGNFSCITGNDPDTLAFDEYTYKNLKRIQQVLGGPQCGLAETVSTDYWDTRPADVKISSLRSYLVNYKEVPVADLPAGVLFGIRFQSWSFNCPKFLFSVYEYLTKQGVSFQKQKLQHVSEAFGATTRVVFNCTGLGAKDLGGVDDSAVYPTRGQVLVVKAPHITENVMRWGDDYATYIIKRPSSHDQLILGGFMQKDDWTADTFRLQNMDILKRTTALYPEILEKNPGGPHIEDLEILRSAAGLRPSRHGGVRIERQTLDNGRKLVHNYGASGYGYQAGFGMAKKAVDLALQHPSKL